MYTSQNFPAMAAPRGSRTYKADEWEAQKVNVERLYITEDLTHQQVIDELQRQYGLVATYVLTFPHIETCWVLERLQPYVISCSD